MHDDHFQYFSHVGSACRFLWHPFEHSRYETTEMYVLQLNGVLFTVHQYPIQINRMHLQRTYFEMLNAESLEKYTLVRELRIFFFGNTSNSNCNKLNSIQPIEKCETQNCASVKAARGKIAITLVHTHQGCNFENVFCDGLFFLSPFCYSFADGCHWLLTFHILVRLVDFHLFIGTYLHCFIFFVFASLKLFVWNVKWNRKKILINSTEKRHVFNRKFDFCRSIHSFALSLHFRNYIIFWRVNALAVSEHNVPISLALNYRFILFLSIFRSHCQFIRIRIANW